MIPSWLVHAMTLLAVAVGFVLGWIWRGWRDRAVAAELYERIKDKSEPPG